MNILVHPIGADVQFGGATAQVTGVNVRGTRSDHITYELVWWANGQRNCAWVEAVELAAPKGPLTIGFSGQH